MYVLGIETTCDETAASVVRDGHEILSNVISSQIELHMPFGGVVPELACRRHAEIIIPIIHQALHEAKVSLNEIDLIGVAQGPGLIGALLVGINAAKGLALGLDRPLVGVNHVEAHLYASLMPQLNAVPLPALGIVLSGGHTALVEVRDIGAYHLIGATLDDAIGEAFDKVATLLGLSYPGGPKIEQLAKEGDPQRYPFKGGKVKGRPLDFSFSGLKTNVLYTVRQEKEAEKKDVAASFQRAAFEDVLEKALVASKMFECKSLLFGGGVTSSQTLRALFHHRAAHLPQFWPPSGLSLDNAAMIAGLAFQLYTRSKESAPFSLSPQPRMKPF